MEFFKEFDFDLSRIDEDLDRAAEEAIKLDESESATHSRRATQGSKENHTRVDLGFDFTLDIPNLGFSEDETLIKEARIQSALLDQESNPRSSSVIEALRKAAEVSENIFSENPKPIKKDFNQENFAFASEKKLSEIENGQAASSQSVADPAFENINTAANSAAIDGRSEIFPRSISQFPSSSQGSSNSKGLSENLSPRIFSIPAFIFDLVLTSCIALSCLSSILLISNLTIEELLVNFQERDLAQIFGAVTFIVIFNLYTIVGRGLYGRTLGEWAFNYQLGTDSEIEKASYIVKIIFRKFILLATGIITLPFLSLIFRKDLTSYLCRLRLYQRDLI